MNNLMKLTLCAGVAFAIQNAHAQKGQIRDWGYDEEIVVPESQYEPVDHEFCMKSVKFSRGTNTFDQDADWFCGMASKVNEWGHKNGVQFSVFEKFLADKEDGIFKQMEDVTEQTEIGAADRGATYNKMAGDLLCKFKVLNKKDKANSATCTKD
jgi:hypothetical protein